MKPYVRPVRRLIAQLLLVLSVLAMPFAMQSAPAAPATQHHAAESMPMGHCPDEQGRTGAEGGIAECTMICASALPPASSSSPGSRLIICEPAPGGGSRPLVDVQPEITTPPPKAS